MFLCEFSWGTSPVTQSLELCLPVQRMKVSLVRHSDPTSHGVWPRSEKDSWDSFTVTKTLSICNVLPWLFSSTMAGLGKIYLRTLLQLLDLPWNMEITLFPHSALFLSFTRAHGASLNMYTKQADLPLHPLQCKRLVGRGCVFRFVLFLAQNCCSENWVNRWRADSLQSCPALFDPMDYSPPGSSVHGTLQARTLEWVAMPSSRGSSRPRNGTQASCSFYIGRQILHCWATGEARTDGRWMNSILFPFFSFFFFFLQINHLLHK